MEFDHYDYVPQLQADKIIAAAKAARTGEEEVGGRIDDRNVECVTSPDRQCQNSTRLFQHRVDAVVTRGVGLEESLYGPSARGDLVNPDLLIFEENE